MIYATQFTNLLLPNEIQSKFNGYIDISSDPNTNSNDLYSSLLKSELHSSFHEILHIGFNKRYLTVYQIEG